MNIKPTTVAALVLLLSAASAGAAADDTTSDMIIRQVRILESGAPSDAPLVNIQIIDGKIELVSEDDIPAEEQSIVTEANGSFLIGRVGIGSVADFVILDTNPAENIDVLVDSKPHVKFAIIDGLIVKNVLDISVALEEPEEPVRNQWISYTPPPFAFSTSVDT